MRLETTMECPVETAEMSASLDRVMAVAGFAVAAEEQAGLTITSIFSDVETSLLAKRGRDVEDEDESDDEDEEFDDEDEDEDDDFDDDEDEEEEEEEDEFEEEFDDDELDDDDDIFYDDDEDE